MAAIKDVTLKCKQTQDQLDRKDKEVDPLFNLNEENVS